MTCSDAITLIPLYLTGELDAMRAGEFGIHTQTCTECARELKQQVAFDARLRAGVLAEPADSGPVERRVMQRIAMETGSREKSWRWAVAAAGLAAVLVMGLIGYRAMFPPKAAGVFAAAARDHRMEIVDRQPRKWRTDLASVSELAARQGISSSVISAIAPAGYHFQQGKICRLDGRLFLHMVYTSSSGDKNFSVFLERQDKGRREGLYASSFGAEHVAGFETGQVKAMIVTGQSEDAALQFARFAASVI